MLVLNLANKLKGDIDYEIVSFSDSQQVINLKGIFVDGKNERQPIKVISRMTWADVQLIIGSVKALREVGYKEIHLFVPYFLGARSDRKFSDGGYNYLKEVICPIINAQNFASVTVMDPHSHCTEMGLDRFKKVLNSKIVQFALADLAEIGVDLKKLVWLIPDKGACDKAYETIKEIGFEGNVVECSKKRDVKTGKIVETNIPHGVVFEGDTCVIVDDICDGGWTFTALAEKAKERGASKIYLVVTHGIFSQGVMELLQHMDGIYCSNSVKEFDVENLLPKPSSPMLFKQLNVMIGWRIGKEINMSKGS